MQRYILRKTTHSNLSIEAKFINSFTANFLFLQTTSPVVEKRLLHRLGFPWIFRPSTFYPHPRLFTLTLDVLPSLSTFYPHPRLFTPTLDILPSPLRLKPVFHLAIFVARTSKKRMWLGVGWWCRQLLSPANQVFSLFTRLCYFFQAMLTEFLLQRRKSKGNIIAVCKQGNHDTALLLIYYA